MPSSRRPTGVTLVFVSTDEKDYLLDAISSAYDSPTKRPLEIIVVDNCSTDETAEAIRAKWPKVKVLERSERHGLYSNLNAGITEATNDYITLCNCDIVFQKGSLNKLASLLDDRPEAGLVAPLLRSPDERRPSARRWYTFPVLLALKGPWKQAVSGLGLVKRSVYDDWDHETAIKVQWVPCRAAMARKGALDDIGPLDESFAVYFGDTDLCLRLHERAWEVWCEPAAVVVHHDQTVARQLHLLPMLGFWLKHRGLRPKRRLVESPSIPEVAIDPAKTPVSAEQVEGA